MNVYDCFRILELPRSAGLEELKCAYRTKAKLYHPDRKGGDPKKFTRLHEAYTFLLDYDLFKEGRIAQGEEERRKRDAELKRKAQERAEQKAREAREKRDREKREEARKAREKREQERKAAASRAAARKAAEASSKKKPSHEAHLAGEILTKSHKDREKIKAIETLVSLKRKSVYPYLKSALYCDSERVVIAAIGAIGKLGIVQAGPEMTSLMCSGSIKIKLALLEALKDMKILQPYKTALEIGLTDSHKSIKDKSKALLEGLNG